jgi:phosphatidate phosphatase APP1
MRIPRRLIWGFTACGTALGALLATASSAADVDRPKRGEVLFFAPPVVSIGDRDVVVQGRLFEPAEQSRRRQAFIKTVAGILRLQHKIDVDADNAIFRERAGFLLSDSKKDARVAVNLGGGVVPLDPSNSAGYVTVNVKLTDEQFAELNRTGTISFESVPTATNANRFSAVPVVVPETGITVVTDMDDTIKHTDVMNRQEALRNTFIREFTAVPGMPELYSGWQREFAPRIHFHVVSAGPWHLYEPLRRFTEGRFPPFTWDMRSLDTTSPFVLVKQIGEPGLDEIERHKIAKIGLFMSRFPKRRVVLVGDSGERDPESYSAILRAFPERVDAVLIRNIHPDKDQQIQTKRYEDLFPREMAARLHVFRKPDELPPLAQMLREQ